MLVMSLNALLEKAQIQWCSWCRNVLEYNYPEIHKVVAELLKLQSMLKSFVFVFKNQNWAEWFLIFSPIYSQYFLVTQFWMRQLQYSSISFSALNKFQLIHNLFKRCALFFIKYFSCFRNVFPGKLDKIFSNRTEKCYFLLEEEKCSVEHFYFTNLTNSFQLKWNRNGYSLQSRCS